MAEPNDREYASFWANMWLVHAVGFTEQRLPICLGGYLNLLVKLLMQTAGSYKHLNAFVPVLEYATVHFPGKLHQIGWGVLILANYDFEVSLPISGLLSGVLGYEPMKTLLLSPLYKEFFHVSKQDHLKSLISNLTMTPEAKHLAIKALLEYTNWSEAELSSLQFGLQLHSDKSDGDKLNMLLSNPLNWERLAEWAPQHHLAKYARFGSQTASWAEVEARRSNFKEL